MKGGTIVWNLERLIGLLFTRSMYVVVFLQTLIVVFVIASVFWTIFEMFRDSTRALPMMDRRKRIMRPARFGLWFSFLAPILSLWGIYMAMEDGVIAIDRGLELNDIFSFLYTLLLPLYAGLVSALVGVTLYYFADFHSISRRYLKDADSQSPS